MLKGQIGKCGQECDRVDIKRVKTSVFLLAAVVTCIISACYQEIDVCIPMGHCKSSQFQLPDFSMEITSQAKECTKSPLPAPPRVMVRS